MFASRSLRRITRGEGRRIADAELARLIGEPWAELVDRYRSGSPGFVEAAALGTFVDAGTAKPYTRAVYVGELAGPGRIVSVSVMPDPPRNNGLRWAAPVTRSALGPPAHDGSLRPLSRGRRLWKLRRPPKR